LEWNDSIAFVVPNSCLFKSSFITVLQLKIMLQTEGCNHHCSHFRVFRNLERIALPLSKKTGVLVHVRNCIPV
jgi:hypothetical protein